MRGILASEWLKLRSLRSTHLIFCLSLSAVVLGVAVAWMAADMYDAAPPERRRNAALAELEEVVVIVPQLFMGMLGALAITSEYATGTIRTTLAVVPRRWPVLAAKSAIVGSLGALAGAVTVFGTYLLSRAVISDRFSGVYAAPILEKLPTLTATSLSVPAFALLGLGLGAILRSTAGAVGILVGMVYVIPIVCGNLPEPWSGRLGSLMIGALPRQITGDHLTNSVYGSLLPPAVAAVALVAYAAAPLLMGAWLLRRRDA